MTAEVVRITHVEVFERPIAFRLPFRYGSVVLTEAPELHVRCHVEFADGAATGYAAELAAPKWFDKNPVLSNEDNFDQLRDATLAAARAASTMGPGVTPARLSRLLSTEQAGHRRLPTGNGLIDAFGVSLIDRAVADATCRHRNQSLVEILRANRLGIDWGIWCDDMAGHDASQWLAQRQILNHTSVRHTVGYVDPIYSRDVVDRPDDAPVGLEEIIARDGVNFFKIKLCGDPDQDLARLRSVAALLDQNNASYTVSLDGNEQYPDVASLKTFLTEAGRDDALARLWQATLFVEQPLSRANSFKGDIPGCSALKPVITDEADDGIDAAIRARDSGYRGISVKTCKGLYKSLLNVARAHTWQATSPFVVSAEDLTAQAGNALAQNLALWSVLGLLHSERNGHYYGPGLSRWSVAERADMQKRHPDLFSASRLNISQGRLSLASTNAAIGFGTGWHPDHDQLRPLGLS